MVRDRLSALLNAVRRQHLTQALRDAGRCVVRRGDRTWVVDHARLVDTSIVGHAGQALPVDPPAEPDAERPLTRYHVDEALVLAPNFNLASLSKQALESRKETEEEDGNNRE